MNMEHILQKVSHMDETTSWTLEETQQLLEIYFLLSKKEGHIFDLIYRYLGCDTWEDIFRDYDERYLNDKAVGVRVALEEIEERIKERKEEEEEKKEEEEKRKR